MVKIKNNNQTNNAADLMANRIKQIVDNANKSNLKLSGAIIAHVNEDNTFDVYFPPDNTKIFTRIKNQSPFILKEGDSVELMLKDGNYNSCWIVAKHGESYNPPIDNQNSALYNIPEPPSANGEYTLHCSVLNGRVVYSWIEG